MSPATLYNFLKPGDGFDALEVDFDLIYPVIKKDIGLVQGKRRPGSGAMKDSFDDALFAEDSSSSQTKIVRMGGTVLKSRMPNVRQENEMKDEFRDQAKRAFSAFCMLHKVSFLPNMNRDSFGNDDTSYAYQKFGNGSNRINVKDTKIQYGHTRGMHHSKSQGDHHNSNQHTGDNQSHAGRNSHNSGGSQNNPANSGGNEGNGNPGGDGGKPPRKPITGSLKVYDSEHTSESSSELSESRSTLAKNLREASFAKHFPAFDGFHSELRKKQSSHRLMGSESKTSLQANKKTAEFQKGENVRQKTDHVDSMHKGSNEAHGTAEKHAGKGLTPHRDHGIHHMALTPATTLKRDLEAFVHDKPPTATHRKTQHAPDHDHHRINHAQAANKYLRATHVQPHPRHGHEHGHTTPTSTTSSTSLTLESTDESESTPHQVMPQSLKHGSHKQKSLKPVFDPDRLDTSHSSGITSLHVASKGPKRHVVNILPRRQSNVLSRGRFITGHWESHESEHRQVTISTVEQVQKRRKLLDSEWLQWSDSDTEVDEDAELDEKRRDAKAKNRPTDPDVQSFMDSIKPVTNLMGWIGLFPYTIFPKGKNIQVVRNPRSLHFALTCFNCILFLVLCVSILTTIQGIFGYEEPLILSQKIIKTEFANHYIEASWVSLMAVFLSIWFITGIMEMGVQYGRFMTRFNLTISVIKYDVTDGIRKTIVWHFSFLATLCVLVICLFFGGREKASFVREGCGFIGYTIIHAVNNEARESIYYPLVELFGLLITLHVFICLNVVILNLTIYAKAIENMAHRFNLRLAYRLRRVCHRTSIGEIHPVTRIIPYNKLFSEHISIMTCCKYFNEVNMITYAAYVSLMSCEMLLMFWAISRIFFVVHITILKRDEKYLEFQDENAIPAVPVRVMESYVESSVKAIFMFFVTFYFYWHFGGVMHNTINSLSLAVEYVRRHGLVLAQDSKERRFILTMINSFAPKSTALIGLRGLQFDRQTLVTIFVFLTATGSAIIQLSPDRVHTVQFGECDGNGNCHLFKLPMAKLERLYEDVRIPEPPRREPLLELPAIPPPTEPPLVPPIDKFDEDILAHEPCNSTGYLPARATATQCKSGWPQTQYYPVYVYTPFVFKQVYRKPKATRKTFNFSGKIATRFADCAMGNLPIAIQDITAFNECISVQKSCDMYPYHAWYVEFQQLREPLIHDCFGNVLGKQDDCNNFKMTSSAGGKAVPAKLSFALTSVLDGVSKRSILCCYEYGAFASSQKQLAVCNMPNAATMNKVCKFDRPRIRDRIQVHHTRLIDRLDYQHRVGKDNGKFAKGAESDILNCLCRMDGSEPTEDEHEMCRFRYLPSCTPGYYTRNVSDISFQCGSVRVPKYFKINHPYKNLTFTSMRERDLTQVCSGGNYAHNPESVNTDVAQYTHDRFPGHNFTLSDCSGEIVNISAKDDCNNFRINTPEGENILQPKIVLKEFSVVTRNGQGKIEENGPLLIHLCCYQYRGEAFETPEQTRYCNAKSMSDMNKPEWCNKAITEGYRKPDKYTKILAATYLEWRLRQKSANKSVTSVYEQFWAECLCKDLRKSPLSQQEEEKVNKKCQNSLPPPCEEPPSPPGIHHEIMSCKTSWNKNPPITVYVPNIFEIDSVGIRLRAQGFSESWSRQCDTRSRNRDVIEARSGSTIQDCWGRPLGNEKDDCDNRRLPNYYEKHPKVILIPELTLPDSQFEDSDFVHCCYDYGLPNTTQTRVCNKVNPQEILNSCRKRKSGYVLTEVEKELARKIRVFGRDDPLKGNLVKITYPLDSGRSEHQIWWKCICQTNVPANQIKQCEKYYMPPCLQTSASTKFVDLVVKCPATWNVYNISEIRLPILTDTYESTNGFRRLKKYKKGNFEKECPDAGYDDYTEEYESSYADCFGQKILEYTDDCSNAYAYVPYVTLEEPKSSKLPSVELVVASKLDAKDENFFCCYRYPHTPLEQAKVCNMPNLRAFKKFCSWEKHSTLGPSRQLKALRRQAKESYGIDILDDHEELNHWRHCLCNTYVIDPPSEEDKNVRCDRLADPPCMKLKPPLKRNDFYQNCTARWGGNGGGTVIVMEMPRIFITDSETELLTDASCAGVATNSSNATDTEGEITVRDCTGNVHTFEYQDDCGNLRIPFEYNPSNTPVHPPTLGIIPFPFETDSPSKPEFTDLYCCYKYDNTKMFQVAHCNQLSKEDTEKNCKPVPKTGTLHARYVKGYLYLLNRHMKFNGPKPDEKKALHCVCAHRKDGGGTPDFEGCSVFDINESET